MSVVARLEQAAIDPAAEIGELIRAARGAGAIVSFVGVARARSIDGSPVDRIVLEHHARLTQRSLEEIARDAAGRFAVDHVRVVHRCGAIGAGEAIVFAAAAAAHRRAAFEATDYLMDRLKTEAIFWKREESAAGAAWIEPTEADYADRGRWE